MTRASVGIVNYGLGNHNSISNSLKKLGYRCKVSDQKSELKECDILLLPGVGAFAPAMQAIQSKELDIFVKEEVEKNKPIIGVCLGMQILGELSFENGETNGLGLLPGKVVPFNSNNCHVGWNSVKLIQSNSFLNTIDNFYFYFNHSYIYNSPSEYVIANSSFDDFRFPSIVKKGKVFGCQFHPEKSQLSGQLFLDILIRGLLNG